MATLTIPTIKIKSISFTGLLIIEFSDPFVPLEDLSLLQDTFYVGASQNITNLEILMNPVEGQTDTMVMKDWTPNSFTESELSIQLNFQTPYHISTEYEPNYIEVKVYNTTFFRRQSDGM